MTGEGNDDGKKGNGSKTIERIAPSSPLYLHPSDSPSLMLTQKIFNGEKYELRADAVPNGLNAKNKLGVVEAMVKKPAVGKGEEETLEAVAWRQCNTMVKALVKNNMIISNWLLDSGASHHMTGQRGLLTNVRKEAPSNVTLPDGTRIIAQEHGQIVLNDNFVLKDVLYVPKLTCDLIFSVYIVKMEVDYLISIKQLIEENNCVVTFYPDYCVIQDQSTRMKIGRGEQRDGVYYLKNDHVLVARTNANNDAQLWHKRLGHPSRHVLPSFKNLVGS